MYGHVRASYELPQKVFRKCVFVLFGIDIGNVYIRAQRRISKYLLKISDGIVLYGEFKGLHLSNQSWWGNSSMSTMILGTYEMEVVKEICAVSQDFKYFIDIGAADGFYAVGLLANGKFEHSFAFEMSKQGRESMFANACMNGVDHSLTIYEKAESDFYLDLPSHVRDNSVILIDVEGYEFQIVTNEFCDFFEKSIIFIEIHEWLVPNGNLALIDLKKIVSQKFEVEYINSGSRNPSLYPELDNFEEEFRWLAFSEGRVRHQYWLKLTPKLNEWDVRESNPRPGDHQSPGTFPR
jgi:hypothetical protein